MKIKLMSMKFIFKAATSQGRLTMRPPYMFLIIDKNIDWQKSLKFDMILCLVLEIPSNFNKSHALPKQILVFFKYDTLAS